MAIKIKLGRYNIVLGKPKAPKEPLTGTTTNQVFRKDVSVNPMQEYCAADHHGYQTIMKYKTRISCRQFDKEYLRDVILELQRCIHCGVERGFMHDMDGKHIEIDPMFVRASVDEAYGPSLFNNTPPASTHSDQITASANTTCLSGVYEPRPDEHGWTTRHDMDWLKGAKKKKNVVSRRKRQN